MATGNLEYTKFYSVMDGKICRQFKEPTAQTKTRVNKTGKTVHEEYTDYISGLITGIETKDSDFGRLWVITLMDENEKQVLQLNYSSGYSQAFLKSLPNLDLNRKTTFIPKQDIQDGKKKTTMFLTQGGKAVKWFYTKDKKNGLPDLDVKEGKGKDKGKKIYDDSEVMEFLETMVNEEIVPNLPKSESDIVIPENAEFHEEEEEDDFEKEITKKNKTEKKTGGKPAMKTGSKPVTNKKGGKVNKGKLPF